MRHLRHNIPIQCSESKLESAQIALKNTKLDIDVYINGQWPNKVICIDIAELSDEQSAMDIILAIGVILGQYLR